MNNNFNLINLEISKKKNDKYQNEQSDLVLIDANNDIDAIKTWLLEFINTSNTFLSYRQTAERFFLWCMQRHKTLADISREDIHCYQQFLTNPYPTEFWCGPSKPRNHHNWKPFVKGLSASSIQLNLQILTAMYTYLMQSGYLMKNPFSLIKKSANVVKNKAIEKYLTHKEWQYIYQFINAKIINTVDNNINYSHKQNNEDYDDSNISANKFKKQQQQYKYIRIKWIFCLLYLTGCRRHEIINAKMSDFINKHDNWWLRVIGKGNKYGEIPVTNDLLAILIDYRRSINLPDYPSNSEHNIALVSSINNINNPCTANNIIYSTISDSMLYKIIKNTCIEVANNIQELDPSAAFVIRSVSTHWLRHTSATHQVDAGIDIRVVKENLRHSMLETTMKYQHVEQKGRHDETNNKFGIK